MRGDLKSRSFLGRSHACEPSTKCRVEVVKSTLELIQGNVDTPRRLEAIGERLLDVSVKSRGRPTLFCNKGCTTFWPRLKKSTAVSSKRNTGLNMGTDPAL